MSLPHYDEINLYEYRNYIEDFKISLLKTIMNWYQYNIKCPFLLNIILNINTNELNNLEKCANELNEIINLVFDGSSINSDIEWLNANKERLLILDRILNRKRKLERINGK